VNAAEVFRLRLQSLLAAGLASSPIAARVGLAAASEVWGGSAPRERPAWYVWLRDRPGAWQLELVAAGALEHVHRAGIVARFTVRHYPAPATPDFARFSAHERSVAAASLDATGTPRIELAATIPDSLFTVGTIDWAVDLDGEAAVFGLASLDRLRTRTESGELVRDVPGWNLATPAFSAVAGLHAQVERRAATRILISRLPGFETVGTDAGGHRDAPEVTCGEGFLLFPGSNGGDEGAAALLRALQDGDAEILQDVELHDGRRRPDMLDADPRLPLTVNRSWFGGEHHAHDRALCAC
jgi:hypothetical protein